MTSSLNRRDFIKSLTGMAAAGILPALQIEPDTHYVNTLTGDDSHDGLTPETAKLTLAALTNGRILITAPADKPVAGFVDFSAGEINLEGLNGVPWYTERTTTWTSDWAQDGDGVYSRPDGGGDADVMFVPTQMDSSGFGHMLLKNKNTPATPAAGEFGRMDGKFYVHLENDEDPNFHTLKRHNTGYLIRASGTARLTVRDCIGRYAGGRGIFENVSAQADLILENCTGQYSAGAGVSIPMGGGTVHCINCTMQRHLNDGYNQHGGSLTLIACDGSYNDDEGASNHDGSVLTINGGRYHHNGGGGCTSVDQETQMNLVNVLVDYNGSKNAPGIERNGINFAAGASGEIINCTANNNIGSGIYCDGQPGTNVTIMNLVSEGNTLQDVLCKTVTEDIVPRQEEMPRIFSAPPADSRPGKRQHV